MYAKSIEAQKYHVGDVSFDNTGDPFFRRLARCNWNLKMPAADPRSERGEKGRRPETIVESGPLKGTPPSQTSSFEL
ncbi:hypothetical protein TNCV_1478461 [Trichonephila clavipes]|nr:hypothetical protein TNCV_1478461 [Trichonephila clavipes]